MEEERIQVLNNMEELEQKIKELDNQMEESAREVERERTEGHIIISVFQFDAMFQAKSTNYKVLV